MKLFNKLNGGNKYEGSYNINPGTNNIVIPKKSLLTENLTIMGDSDLVANNIKEGVNIFGINGTMKEEQVSINGIPVNKKINFKSYSDIDISESRLPYGYFENGCAVVLNDEIHILSGMNSSLNGTQYHYKYDGSAWTSVSTLPSTYGCYRGCAVVLNDEIHIIGGVYPNGSKTAYSNAHYKWNGSSWTNTGNLSFGFADGCAVVYNNEIHILGNGSSYTTTHYKYDGSSWVEVSTLPFELYAGSAVVYDNNIYVIYCTKDDYTTSYLYKYDGSSWTRVGSINYFCNEGCAVVLNDEIYFLGGDGNTQYSKRDRTARIKYNGSSFISLKSLPYEFYRGCAVVLNDEIHILGDGYSRSNTNYMNHYILNTTLYKQV